MALTVGDGRSYRNILQSCIAIEQSVESCQQGHEESGPFRSAERFESLRKGRRKRKGDRRPVERLHRRSGSVGWQFQHRQAVAKPALPIFKLLIEDAALKPLPLPDSKVA